MPEGNSIQIKKVFGDKWKAFAKNLAISLTQKRSSKTKIIARLTETKF